MTELKPCPFCGCPPTKGILSYEKHYVSCTNEDCLIESCASVGDTEEQAIEAWNTRPNPWHTGEPTEKCAYLVTDGLSDYVVSYFDGMKFSSVYFPNNGKIVKWQKIEDEESDNG